MFGCVMCSRWSVCLLLLSVAPCLPLPITTDLHSDITNLHNAISDLDPDISDLDTDLHSGVHRTQRSTHSIQVNGFSDRGGILPNDQTHQTNILQSSIKRLYDAYLGGTGHVGDLSNVKVRSRLRIPEVEEGSRKLVVEFKDDDSDVKETNIVQKRYYRRRHCNFAQLTRQAFVELIKTGKLCGRRVATIRFGLTG